MNKSRKTIIFGNGLGMALDPVHFSLKNAISHIWSSGVLERDDKILISNCLPQRKTHHIDEQPNHPESEDDLDLLHVAISSCQNLFEIKKQGNPHWLSPYGFKFPTTCQQFVFEVALHLSSSNKVLDEYFTGPLASFIKNTNSHIATLNYDQLIYDAILSEGLVNGFDGHLVDGFTNKMGFSNENMRRMYGKNFGLYLHLHGSPLFYEDYNALNKYGCVLIKKQARKDMGLYQYKLGRHIVLTHIKHKPSIIAGSEVLSAYWNHLTFALSESEGVMLFGYSGLDVHLNEVLTIFSQRRSFPITVVEWSGAGRKNERMTYWENQLRSNNLKLIQMDNILHFNNW